MWLLLDRDYCYKILNANCPYKTKTMRKARLMLALQGQAIIAPHVAGDGRRN